MGRPSFKPTVTMRRSVSAAAGGGMTHEEIAIALGISRNTLEKHFERELSVVALQRRMEVLVSMHRIAKKGNVSAQRAYLAFTPASSAPPVPKEPGEKPSKAVALGKKEIAQAEGVVAEKGTSWESLLSPQGPVQ